MAGAPVEVQVRTAWQHEWAETFEKLADRLGRGIRYGDPADPSTFAGLMPDQEWRVDAALEYADAVSEVIDAAEELDREGDLNPEYRPQLEKHLQAMRERLAWFG